MPAQKRLKKQTFQVKKKTSSKRLQKPSKSVLLTLKTPIGFLQILIKDKKLYSIQKVRSYKKVSQKLDVSSQKIKEQLEDYFSLKRKDFSIPLAQRGTVFQNQVWKVLQNIPYGEVKTYKEISLKLGSPYKSRAVGQACSKNPFLVVVPCHRVLSQNSLGGFALGLKAKKTLLALEQ